MRATRLTFIALAASLSFGISDADESETTDVVIVTATRPATLETQRFLKVDQAESSIDFSALTIEAPKLDPSEIELEPPHIDLALRDDAESKT